MNTAGVGKGNKIHLLQGEYLVVDDPNIVIATMLGSCVAACLRDPAARIGGMNHFLLPGDDAAARSPSAERYGAHLMELLVNDLQKRGARRERLEAKLFGGARMGDRMWSIGARNAAFARQFLMTEGIPIVAADLGGNRGRRIEYHPVSGRARQIFMRGDAIDAPLAAPSCAAVGAVEFFDH